MNGGLATSRYVSFALWLAAIVSIGALAAAVFAKGGQPIAGAYLWAWLFWLGPSAGSIALLMIHRLTGGRWGDELTPILRPIAQALPLMAILFVPVLLTVDHIYPWATDPRAAADETVARLYLNVPAFGIRAIAILVLWSILSILVAGRPNSTPLANGIGLILYAVSASIAGVDWAMSIEPRFSSTLFGIAFIMLQLLAALAFAGIWRPGNAGGTPRTTTDHASLLLAALLGVLYLEFMQYLVIWAGDLPAKATWYLVRMSGGWNLLLLAAFVIGIVVPFFLLLGGRLRGDPRWVAGVSALILLGTLFFWRWQMASIRPGAIVTVSDLAAPVALGAVLSLWISFFKKRGEARNE